MLFSSSPRAHRTRRRGTRLGLETLEARRLLVAEIEPNDDLVSATAFSAGNPLSGTLAQLGDVDYFKINLSQGETLSVDYSSATFSAAVTADFEILDGDGNVLAQRFRASHAPFIAPATGTYYVRATSSAESGTYLGAYEFSTRVDVSVSSPLLEVEPNDASTSALAIGTNVSYLAGNIASATDRDFFRISGATAGQVVTIDFPHVSAKAPDVILRSATNTIVASGTTGTGLYATLPSAGDYTLEFASDTATGPYLASYRRTALSVVTSGTDFASATMLAPTSATPVNAIGNLASLDDLRVYAFDASGLEHFTLGLTQFPWNRSLRLYDEAGREIAYSAHGGLSTYSIDVGRAPTRYYLTVQALNEAALGPYEVSIFASPRAVNAQRDVPLFFLDFNQQVSHLDGDFDWVNSFSQPGAIPFIKGMFESRYDAFDVDLTDIYPGSTVNHVGQGYGNFGDIGAGGWGGGDLGVRRPVGDAVTGVTSMNVASFNYGATSTMIHEFGHAVGLGHVRHPRGVLGYDTQTDGYPYGNGYSFIAGDSYFPVNYQENSRDYLDFVLQAGRNVVEAEPNNTAAQAQQLDRALAEMRLDMRPGASVTAIDRILQIEPGDFNGDGNLDIVTLRSSGLLIFVGDGNGNFSQRWLGGNELTPVGSDLSDVVTVGDVNGDGRSDVVGLRRGDANAWLWIAAADGTLGTPTSVALSAGAVSVRMARFNADARPDLIVGYDPSQFGVLLGNGVAFGPQTLVGTGLGNSKSDSLVAGNIDGDAFLDLVLMHTSSISIVRGKGDGTFHPGVTIAVPGAFPNALALWDYTGDGKLDIAVGTTMPPVLRLYANDGNGVFPAIASQSVPLNGAPFRFGVGDLDADGRADLAISGGGDVASAILSLGGGVLSDVIRLPGTMQSSALTVFDANEDGRDDVIVGETSTTINQIVPLLGQANDPRNDRGVVIGRIAGRTDSDEFSFTVAAGQTWSIDIDSAEFQNPLDAVVTILNAAGDVIAASDDALDRESGLDSVDPYLVHTFAAAGTYRVRVTSKHETVGDYRLKLTPQAAWDTAGPRVIAALPSGTGLTSTRQVVLLLNDILDPASLTSANVIVTGNSTGVKSGTVAFDPQDSTLVWTADTALPIDTYTVRLKGDATGVRDLRGNQLDGETSGTLVFPQVSGNGAPGGDFVHTFAIGASDTTPATVTSASYRRHPYQRGLFTLNFNVTNGQLSLASTTQASWTLRGAGPDGAFNTADDRLAPLDPLQEKTQPHTLYLYARGIPDPDRYRIEGSIRDAAGNNVAISHEVIAGVEVPATALFTTAAQTTPGLSGSYINSSLRGYLAQDDWRVSQASQITGSRIDPRIHFNVNEFGARSPVGITGGSDANWDNFSVQWDGYVKVDVAGTRLYTRNNDGSRMWIDLDGDGFELSELVNNGWGSLQSSTITSALSAPLAPGLYPVRIQYETDTGNNEMLLEWITPDVAGQLDNVAHGPAVIASSIQPGAHLPAATADSIALTFSGALDLATLTTANFKVRHSTNPTFHDADDVYLVEANDAIAWDATTHRATFTAAQPFAAGYYLVELSGDAGGIASRAGQLLDGEFLDSFVAGSTNIWNWQQTPSGDGLAGGDYVAYFSVSTTPLITHITSDNGASAGDGVTNDPTLILHGKASPGATVEVTREGAGVIGNATANASGDWSFDYTATTLADGMHRFTATATTGGFTSSPSMPLTVSIDTQLALPAITGISNDTGASTLDGITSDRTLVLSGTADPGTTLVLSRSGAGNIATINVGAGGTWTFDYTGQSLADGIYTFTATSSDLAGNSAVSAGFVVTVDTVSTTPVLTSISSDNGISTTDFDTNDETLVLFGTAEPLSTVEIRRTSQLGQLLGTTVVDAAGNWSFDYTHRALAHGQASFYMQGKDLAGNMSAWASKSVFLDNEAAHGWPFSELENNGTAGEATDASRGFNPYDGYTWMQSITGELSSASDSDYYFLGRLHWHARLHASALGTGGLGGTNANLRLELYRAGTATPIAMSEDDGPNLDAMFTAHHIDADGDYYLRVSSTSGALGTYRLSIAVMGILSLGVGAGVTAESEANDSLAAADDLSQNWRQPNYTNWINGGAPNTSDVDFYRYEFQAGDMIVVDGSIAGGQLPIELRDSSQNVLVRDLPTTSQFQIDPFRIPATGTYYLRMGNATGVSSGSAYSFVIYLATDGQPPLPTPIGLLAASDTGSSNTDGITSDTTPTILVGPAQHNNTMELYRDGVLVASRLTAFGEFTWNHTSPELAPGAYVYRWRIIDHYGNPSSMSEPRTIYIDAAAPSLPAYDPVVMDEDTEVQLVRAVSDTGVAGGLVATIVPSNTTLFPAGSITANIAAGNLTLTLNPADHLFGTSNVTVHLDDLAGNRATRSFLVTVNSVNDPPQSIGLSGSTIQENMNGTVGTLSVVTVDPGETHTWSVDDPRFTVVTNQLRILPGGELNFEAGAVVPVNITATDPGGLSLTRLFNITVVDVNEAPTGILLSNTSIPENSPGFVVGTITVLDQDIGNTHDLMVNDGTRFEIVGTTLKLKDGVSLDAEGAPVSIIIFATDQGGLGTSRSFNLTVTNINEAPTNLVLSANTIAENAEGTLIGNFTITDLDGVAPYTFIVSDARLEVVGTQLRTRAGQSFNYEAEQLVPITVEVTDAGGLTLSKPFTIVVNDVNEAPTAIQLSGSLNVDENVANALIGILSTIDPDAGNTHTYTVSDGPFVISGNQLRIPAGSGIDFETTPTVTVDVTSRDNLGLTLTRPFVITINNVNERPTFTLSDNHLPERAPGAIVGNLTINDPDVGDTHTWILSDDRFEVVAGQLKLKDDEELDYESGPTTFVVQATVRDAALLSSTQNIDIVVDNVNEAPTALELSGTSVPENSASHVVGTLSSTDPEGTAGHVFAVDDIRFIIVGNQLRVNGTAFNYEVITSVPVTLTVTDPGGLAFERDYTIQITNVNEAPTDFTLANSTVAENDPGGIVGDLTIVDPDGAGTYSWSVFDGRFEVVGHQLKLRPTQSLNFEAASSIEVEMRLTDGPFFLERTFTITVTDVNEAPTALAIDHNAIDENVPLGVVGTMLVFDPDIGATHTFTVSDGRFEVALPSRQLRLKAGAQLDFETEPSVSLDITAIDAGGLSKSATFSIVVNDVNEAPTAILPTSDIILENRPGGIITSVGFMIIDPDFGDSHTLAVDDPRFEIVDGQLKLRPGIALDFEQVSLVILVVTATDAGGLSLAVDFTVTVVNENEQPTAILLAGGSILENAPGAAVGTLSVIDPDTGDTHAWEVDDSRFEILTGGQLKLKPGVALDREAAESVSLTISATDLGGLSRQQTFVVDVTNVNEAPTDITLSRLAVEEATLGAEVSTIAAVDPDLGDSHTWVLSDARFTVAAGRLRLLPGQSLNFETEPSLELIITARDAGGLSFERTITLSVLPQNEPPTAVALASSGVEENELGALIGALSATDPDFGDSHTFATADPRFEISGATLRLIPAASLNFEAGAVVSVLVTATDSGGLSRQQAVSFNVLNVPESPTAIALSRLSVFRGIAGAWIAEIAVTDPDFQNSHVMSVNDPRFEVRGAHLFLRAGETISLPAGATIPITLSAVDAAAGAQFDQSFVLTVVAAPPDWNFAGQWRPHPFDVNVDGVVSPLDALLVIIRLNAFGPSLLTPQPGGTAMPLFYDTSGDNAIGPQDALLVINYLNSGGAGEAALNAAADEVFRRGWQDEADDDLEALAAAWWFANHADAKSMSAR